LADEESDPERAQWFREALASGKPFRDTAGGYIHYYHPFLVGEDPRPWVLRASLPVSVPRTAMLFKILEFGVGLLISLLIMAVTLNYIIRRNLLIPFEDIKSIMGAVASGDLKIARSEAARDEIGDIKRSIYLTVDGLTTIVTEVQEAVAQLEETSKMMAGSAQRFTDLSQGQASSAEESAASVEELTASAQMAATSVARSVDTVEDITQRVGTLNEHIVGINQEMRNLTEKSNRSAGQAREGETSIREATTAMGAIRESGSRITEILSIITSISDKTNLLSLNAAIEAARAGDAGRGFAVVADEISRLADQTAHSVKEIGQLIGTTGAAVENGHERVIRAAAVLQQIIDSTEEIDHLSHNVQDRLEHQRSNVSQIKDQVDALRSAAREIGHAMNEQKGATLEIGLTVSSISEGSQELSSGAGVLAGNAQHLQSQARRLARLLRRFRT
jgi:methyl-accepting chemotaxis protein